MRGICLTTLRVVLLGLALAVLAPAGPASADFSGLLSAGSCSQKDGADANTGNGVQLPITFCDDGIPPTGGTTPNVGAVNAVAVPAKYTGSAGLPAKAGDAAGVPGADPAGDIALDADVTLPDPATNPMPAGGYPIVVMMHGCCTGSKAGWERATLDGTANDNEGWHYNNAWFASRGYVVLNYTARGFVD